MKWILSSSALLALSAPAVHADQAVTQKEPLMFPHTHIAYHHVKEACQADVDRLCHGSSSAGFLRSTVAAPPSLGLSFLLLPDDAIMSMEQTMAEFDRALDQTIAAHQRGVVSEVEDQGDSTSVVAPATYSGDAESTSDQPCNHDDQSMNLVDFLMLEMLSTMFDEPPVTFVTVGRYDSKTDSAEDAAPTAVQDELPQLAHGIQSYGKKIVDQHKNDPNSQVSGMKAHVARRLSEITVSDLEAMKHSLRLPFTHDERICLRRSVDRLSPNCARSINAFHETAHVEIGYVQDQTRFCNLLWVYICLVTILMACMAWRYNQRTPRIFLRHSILQTVYDNPSIKKSVESDLGVSSIGETAPTNDSHFDKRYKLRQNCKLFLIVLIFAMVIFAPAWVLPLCIALTLIKICKVIRGILTHKNEKFQLPSEDLEDCCCCCCGGVSPDSPLLADSETEDIKIADPCCGCCKGTGTCSVACANCCCCNGDETAPERADSGCCNGGCCCSSSDEESEPKGHGQEHRVQSEVAVYQGVPVQIV